MLFQKGHFAEDGEYQKNLYGTSIESIQQVIERSRTAICVMNAPSIKIMREKMLKPYVIFIKPPNRFLQAGCVTGSNGLLFKGTNSGQSKNK